MFSNFVEAQVAHSSEDECVGEGVFVFETAFEIANPIGGINTVLKTKAPSLLERISKKSFGMLGMWPGETEEVKLVTEDDPKAKEDELFKAAFSFSHETGITVKCGEWLVANTIPNDAITSVAHCPRVVFFVPGSYDTHKGRLDDARYRLWNKYKLGFPEYPEEHNHYRFPALVLGLFVSLFVEHAARALLGNPSLGIHTVILHSHEWCGGIGQVLLSCNADNPQSAELARLYSRLRYVFTTHATILGRHLSAAGMSVQQIVAKSYTDSELYGMANQHGIIVEYGVERVCAETATVFTTVSEVTAREAGSVLHVKPHLITLNGSFALDTPGANIFSTSRHSHALVNFVREHFSKFPDVDPENMIVFLCCGRNEFTNKGIDVFLHSLALLNKKLKRWTTQDLSSSSVISLDVETSDCLQKAISIKSLIGEQRVPTVIGVLIAPTQNNEHQQKYPLPKGATAPPPPAVHTEYASSTEALYSSRLVTHRLDDPWREDVIRKAIELKLNRRSPSRSTYFVWIPKFLPVPDILPISIRQMYDCIDVGVFPSKYEPWGYTPIECAESGAPSISTNLAGSGCFFDSKQLHEEGWRANETGILVVDRKHSTAVETAVRICDAMFDFITLDMKERAAVSQKCRRAVHLISWSRVIVNYVVAYNLAAEKVEGGRE